MNLCLSLILLLGANGNEDGLIAYREGRYEDALAAFSAAEREAGDAAPPELLYNKALAALRLGRLPEAEAAADAAATRDAAYAGRRDFLLGNVAYARCDQAVATVKGPEAGPLAWDTAIAYATAARDAWRRAAMSRDDWPEARRNVERAQARIADLERQKADSKKPPSKTTRERKPEKKPAQLPPKQRDPKNRESRPEASRKELSKEQVARLLIKLGKKEKEKAALRRKQQGARTKGVENDW